MKLPEAIEALKKRSELIKGWNKEWNIENEFAEAIDTVLSSINTENKTGLDDNLDDTAIEQAENKDELSSYKDKKYSPELLQTHVPFMEEMEEMDELLVRKKLGVATIVKAQSIISRCHLHGMEVGFNEGMKWAKSKFIKNALNS